jgi:hypothetical protein
MSAEKIRFKKQDVTNINTLDVTNINTPEISEVKFSGRVDMNDLLARARKEKNKENKINLVFLGLTVALVLVVGIILSF